MSRFVETMFGMLIFFAIIFMFQLHAWIAMLNSWHFTQATTEMSQIVREEGGVGEIALTFKDTLNEGGVSVDIVDAAGQPVTGTGHTGEMLYITYSQQIHFAWGVNIEPTRTDSVFITRR